MDKTIEYYNQNADVFARGTRLVDFTVIQEHFIEMIPSGSKILGLAVALVGIQNISLRKDTR